MKKITISIAFLLVSISYNAQVGVNTDVPNSTLDVKEKRTAGVNDTSANDGILIPKLSKLELADKNATAYATAQNGTIIYVSNILGTAVGTSLAQVQNIDAVGFYYFDATLAPFTWKKLDLNTNLYNIDGTLSSARTLRQGTNNLIFQDNNPRDISSTSSTIVFGQKQNPVGGFDQNPAMVINAAAGRISLNKRDPRVTLDVHGSSFASANSPDGILIPKMTVLNLRDKLMTTYQSRATSTPAGPDGMYTHEGTLVYIMPDSSGSVNPGTTGASASKVTEVTKEGLYYYGIDDKWHPVGANVSTNLYNTNGSLSGNRIVTQGANTLAFTASAVNAFSVDGTTLSVDATNDRLGVGTAAPTNKLHVSATANPLKLGGLVDGTLSDKLLTVNSSGEVKTIPSLNTLGLPTPAIFKLDSNITNFLNGVSAGASTNIPMSVVKNSIAGLTYNATTGLVQLPTGTYQISVIYEAEHNATGCTLSSYIVDFPFDQSTTRIHSTASHNQGATSNHGGTILYSTRITSPISWNLQMGRGQSGNCTGPAMTLIANSTQVLILRMGD